MNAWPLGSCCLAALLTATGVSAATQRETLAYGGFERTYLVHFPAGDDGRTSLPLVLVFHGGGLGSAAQAERSYGFCELADQKHFLAVFPEGLDHHWNDGRQASRLGQALESDDTGFVAALIDHLVATHRVDPKRVYATGISNGGIFYYALAAQLSAKIAAIAPVAGNLAEPLAEKFAPAEPVSVIAFNGTADRFVPYSGGSVVGRNDSGGRVLSAADTLALWVKANGCAAIARIENIPVLGANDGITVTRKTHRNGKNSSEVILYTIEGGGHTWPGSKSPLLYGLITGKTAMAINATELMWAFFEKHSKR